MSFILRKGNAEIEEWTISSLALNPGDCIEVVAGATNAGTAPTASTYGYYRKGVAIETTTTSSTTVKVQVVDPTQVWEMTTTANTAASSNGANFNFYDKASVTNTHAAEDESGVVQIGVVGAAADKKILGRFTDASGIDPAAA